MTADDLSNEAFPFGTSRVIDLGYARVRASRVTYVGELGWELYIATEFATGVFDTIVAAGVPFGLRHAGYHALNSLRMEKGYRHWGHDITPDETPLEAGLGFVVAWDKPGGFIGRDALLRAEEGGLRKRLVQFALADPDKLLYHNEPIWRDGVIVGTHHVGHVRAHGRSLARHGLGVGTRRRCRRSRLRPQRQLRHRSRRRTRPGKGLARPVVRPKEHAGAFVTRASATA